LHSLVECAWSLNFKSQMLWYNTPNEYSIPFKLFSKTEDQGIAFSRVQRKTSGACGFFSSPRFLGVQRKISLIYITKNISTEFVALLRITFLRGILQHSKSGLITKSIDIDYKYFLLARDNLTRTRTTIFSWYLYLKNYPQIIFLNQKMHGCHKN